MRKAKAGGQAYGTRGRHIPQRTCISCRQSDSKRALIRLVRTAEERVEVDPSGKRPGRGAYLCIRWRCWELALRRQMIGRALRVDLQTEDRAALESFAKQLALVDEPLSEEATQE